MNYKETLDSLYDMMPDFQVVGAAAYKPGLERVEEFNNVLGRPDRSFSAIHVAGTNGKGSVSHMIASILQAAGYKTGLYTSPHLTDFRERIKVDGEMIPEREVVEFAAKYMGIMRAIGLSFFEATMCMAFDYFARTDVEVAVIETGLGGRLDSTNIISPIASIITNIGLEHQSFLGGTIGEIASEKAGIIKFKTPVVVGERGDESDPVFTAKAHGEQSEIIFAQDCYACRDVRKNDCLQTFTLQDKISGKTFEVSADLLGDYQCRNIVTVLASVDTLNKHTPLTMSRRAVSYGLANASVSTGLRGRWQVLGRNPLVVADTGHNAHGLKLVVDQIRSERYEKLFVVIGMAEDKDFDAVLELLPREAYWIFTAAAIKRALPAGELAARAEPYGLRGEIVDGVANALARAKELASDKDMIFIGGSTFTVAEII